MNWIALIEKLFTSKPSEHNKDKGESIFIESLDFVHLLRSAGSALSAQVALHGRLACVEWEEEKHRLLQLLIVTLFAFACSLCIMLFAGVLIIAVSWDTIYRVHTIIGLIVIYGIGLAIAWHRFKILVARGSQAFAATRAELATDIALIKSKL